MVARTDARVPRRPPTVAARLLARLRLISLDQQLASGLHPWHSPSHAARAVQLTSPRSRGGLADSLERLIADSENPPRRYPATAAVAPCRGQVLEALPQIHAVAECLRSPMPVDARGVARLRVLLCDGTGPCYTVGSPRGLADALDEVARWLYVTD